MKSSRIDHDSINIRVNNERYNRRYHSIDHSAICKGAYISEKADTRLLWIRGKGLISQEWKVGEVEGRSCRRIGRSAGAR